MNTVRGFTLLELMIALTLGLLISAAAIQVFVTANQGINFQQGAANIQNSGKFGLDYIVKDIRRSNIDSNQAAMTVDTQHGGIVLKAENLTSVASTLSGDVRTQLESFLTTSAVGPSNLKDLKSDQLVIQYKNTIGSQYNCEGKRVLPNQFVVQRYFVKEENASGVKSFSLRCKAYEYSGDNETVFNLSGDGEMLIPNVEHFRVLFGIAKDTGVSPDGVMDQFAYVSPSEYKKLADKPQIVSIQMGILLRSPEAVSKGTDKTSFTVLDLVNKELISHNSNSKYIRQVITQTIALRNGFGVKNQAE